MDDLEFEAAHAQLQQQQELLEQVRDRRAKAQQRLKKILDYMSPDIHVAAQNQTPWTKLPGAAYS